MTAAGAPPAQPGSTATGDTSSDTADLAERVLAIVRSMPAVAAVSHGAFGEVATYLPGRVLPGIRIDDGRVEIHLVAVYGPPLADIAHDVGAAVRPVVGDRRVDVSIDDIRLPDDILPDDNVAMSSDDEPGS